MTHEDLTPAEREAAQLDLIRRYLARLKRARFAAMRKQPARVTYDVAGNVVALQGQPVTPHVSTWREDRG